ncbi:MAG: tetratricopeptide repeat protein [Brevinematales bacterium]|nr:tetratricopeptide repeat protein [Brevinematales bacterium]
MDRDRMKENIRFVVSNLIAQARADIFMIVSEVIKEAFVDTLRGETFTVMKQEMRTIVGSMVREIIEFEIREAFSSMRDFATNSSTNEFKLKEGSHDINLEQQKDSNKSDINKRKAKELYSRAMELLDEEDYSGARRLLEDASSLDPENVEIRESLRRISTLK